ncbi:hypothetical protein FOXYSP1_00208 [Fusarium oxysporum f. sp. phaseoli]
MRSLLSNLLRSILLLPSLATRFGLPLRRTPLWLSLEFHNCRRFSLFSFCSSVEVRSLCYCCC